MTFQLARIADAAELTVGGCCLWTVYYLMCRVCTFPSAVLRILSINATHWECHRKWWGIKNHCRTKVRAVSLSKLLYPLQHSIWLILQCIGCPCRSAPLRLCLSSLLIAKHVREGRSDVKVYFWRGFDDCGWGFIKLFSYALLICAYKQLDGNKRRIPDVIPLAHRGSGPSSNTYFKITLGLGSDSASFSVKMCCDNK